MHHELADVGVQLSRTSFDRGQFGARKKLKTKTQDQMRARGRGMYDPEDGHGDGDGGTGGHTSAAVRGAAWQQSAAARVAKQTGGTPAKGAKVAFATDRQTPQKGGGERGGSPTKQQQGSPVDVSARGRFAGKQAGAGAGAAGGQLPALPAAPLAGDGLGQYKRTYRSPPAGKGAGKVHPQP